MNAHREIRVAKAAVAQVLADLDHFLGDDHALKLDMLEGETNFLDVIRALLNENEDDEGIILALDSQIDDRAARKARALARIDGRKKAISSLMDCAQETSLKLPEATLSLRSLKPRPKVVDADELPDEFVTVSEVRKADLDAIKEAIEAGHGIPPGVVMTNGGSSLTVRRK